ncbi:MAG: hypothetical protein CSA50_08390 [Gammaproteobacteria bacterium]|nr:MAG: hypothetical protein CSA50_08390 [Gammaproteobacteria bacterium]
MQLRDSALLPDELKAIRTDCGPRVPYDLCSTTARIITAQAGQTPSEGQPAYQLLITDYSEKEKAVSINPNASTAQYRVTATAVFQLRRNGQVLTEKSVSQKSTYYHDATQVLGKEREKAIITRHLNQRIAHEIPYLLAPFDKTRIQKILQASASVK